MERLTFQMTIGQLESSLSGDLVWDDDSEGLDEEDCVSLLMLNCVVFLQTQQMCLICNKTCTFFFSFLQSRPY